MQVSGNIFNPADKFRPVKHHIAFRKLQAVINLIRSETEIKRHDYSPGFQYAEIDRQVFQAVHEQYGAFLSF